ncbi:MAG: hypothetical protein K9M84_02520 [Spirochaetia bacterium]|nr:hypothetical protein [Spirochaetia bacterium]
MENRVVSHRQLLLVHIVLLMCIMAAAGAQQAPRTGLLPIFSRQTEDQRSLELLYTDHIYEQVYRRAADLFTSEAFSRIYHSEDQGPAQELVPLYDEGQALFTDELLFSLDQPPVAAYIMKRYDLEQLVYGRFRTIDSVSIIELFLMGEDAQPERIYSRIITAEQLPVVTEELLITLVERLTGKQTGALSISGSPQDMLSLQIDGLTVSVDDTVLQVLPYSSYRIDIRLQGRTIDSTTVLIDQDRQQLAVRLQEPVTEQYYISSLPGGASLYVEAEPIGTSGMLYTFDSAQDRLLTAELPGYIPEHIRLSEAAPGELTIALRPDWMSRTSQIEVGKRAWYSSLGVCIASLPISILSKFLYDTTGDPLWKLTYGVGVSLNITSAMVSLRDLIDYYHRID